MKCNQCSIGNVVDEWCPRCGVEQPAPPKVAEPAKVAVPKAAPPKPAPKATVRKPSPVKKPGIVKRAVKKVTRK